MASPLPSVGVSIEWAPAIAAWVTSLRAAGRPHTTLRLRRYQLVRLSHDLAPAGPWQLCGEDLVQWIGSQGWSNDTMSSFRTAVRTFYEWAIETGRATASPARALPKIRVGAPNPRPVPNIVYHEALARADARVAMMLRLAGELGMRCAEVARAHTDDLDRDLFGWSMVVHGKGGKIRRVPIPDELEAAIRSYIEQNGPGWLFPSRQGGHLRPAYVGRIVAAVLPGGWSMHKLRHRFATALHEAVGGDLLVVQEALGHESVETTRRYVRVSSAKLRAGVEAVGRL